MRPYQNITRNAHRALGMLLKTAIDSELGDEIAHLGGTGVPTSGTYGDQTLETGQVGFFWRQDAPSLDEMIYVTFDGGTTIQPFAPTGDPEEVSNNSGGPYAAGDQVYMPTWDATAGVREAVLADSDDPAKQATHVITETIADGATGIAQKHWIQRAVNTSGYSAADVLLYLTTTATTTNTSSETIPTAKTDFGQEIGLVAVKDAAAGIIVWYPGAALINKHGNASLQADVISADATGRALLEDDLFDAATLAAKVVLPEGNMLVGNATDGAVAFDASAADVVPSGNGTTPVAMALPTQGIVCKTALNTAAGRTLTNATNGGTAITNGDGVSGNPTTAVDLNDLAAAAVDVANDSLAIIDATDSGSKQESLADLATAQSGNGLGAAAGVQSVTPDVTTGGTVIPVDVGANGVGLDVQDIAPAVAAAVVDPTADTVLIGDADAAGVTAQESVDDLVTALAGAGLRNVASLFAFDPTYSPTFATMTLTGDLLVQGSSVIGDFEHFDVDANYMVQNTGYTTAVAVTGGRVVNYLPTATADDTVGAGVFVAGIAATSDPTITTQGAATFAASDIVMIDGAEDIDNNGIFEVVSHAANLLTLRSTANGVTNRIEAFTLDQITANGGDVGATITKVTVAVDRAGTDGRFEAAAGDATGLVYSDYLLASDIGTSVQAYDAMLAAMAGLTSAAGEMLVFTGADTPAVLDVGGGAAYSIPYRSGAATVGVGTIQAHGASTSGAPSAADTASGVTGIATVADGTGASGAPSADNTASATATVTEDNPVTNTERFTNPDVSVNIIAQQAVDFDITAGGSITQPGTSDSGKGGQQVQVAFSGTWDGGNVEISGMRMNGNIASEEIVVATGSTVQSVYGYAAITRVRNLGTRTAGTVDVQTGLKLAVPTGALTPALNIILELSALTDMTGSGAINANGLVDVSDDPIDGANDYLVSYTLANAYTDAGHTHGPGTHTHTGPSHTHAITDTGHVHGPGTHTHDTTPDAHTIA